MERVLGISSIGVGLLATTVLAVAVSVDYWLYTVEPIDTDLMSATSPSPADAPGQLADNSAAAQDDDADAGPAGASSVIMVTTHSGLWRVCVYASQPDHTEDEYDVEMAAEHRPCDFISYFGQSYERVDTSATSESILRDIRKATPVIMFALILMFSAQVINVVGYMRQDYRTVVGAILSIISALGLALGQIFYISAVNDEVSQWKRPDNATDDQNFSYHYGWAFYAAGSSFICLMVAAVGNITVYVRRYYERNDVTRILTVVPGLEAKMASTGNDQRNVQPETVVGEVDEHSSRPTTCTSNMF